MNMHGTQKFEIRPRGVSAQGNPSGSVWFDAYSVKMFASNNAANANHELPATGGQNLMVTGQLSGCAFAIHDKGGGSLIVAHIKPGAGANDAMLLHQGLKNLPYWTVVYGREDYATDRRIVSVVGCRIAAAHVAQRRRPVPPPLHDG